MSGQPTFKINYIGRYFNFQKYPGWSGWTYTLFCLRPRAYTAFRSQYDMYHDTININYIVNQ